jgi:hypothetical protein
MLGFLSFVVVLAMLSGAIGLIAFTVGGALDEIGSALRGTGLHRVKVVAPRPRAIRQVRSASHYRAVLRAAA